MRLKKTMICHQLKIFSFLLRPKLNLEARDCEAPKGRQSTRKTHENKRSRSSRSRTGVQVVKTKEELVDELQNMHQVLIKRNDRRSTEYWTRCSGRRSWRSRS